MQPASYILIVDDTPEHIQTAGTILLKRGYQIRIATSGAACLEMVEKELPSIILLDIQMNDMDGFTVCKHLKSNPATADIPIIFVTSDTNRASLQKGFALGAQDYIMKPYHASELIARVNAHQKLYAQSLELKAAYDELNQFCHSVSHDLKAPLQVITQLVEVLREELGESNCEAGTSITPMIEDILNKLTSKCNSTITMIERLLEFSKMTEMSCQYEAVDLSQLVPAIFRDLSSLYPNRQILFSCDPLPTISADATLVSLLIQNILGNSIKFTGHKEKAVLTVTGKELPKYYQIDFSDNGVGFDMEYADKLFHVFERLHTQEEFEGTGVGLAIVKRIMLKHGGDVSINSAPGEGTTVTLLFQK